MAPLFLASRAMRFDLRRWSLLSSLLALGLAAIVLVAGWGAGIDILVRLNADFAAMVPATAISIACLALAQLMQHAPWDPMRKGAAVASTAVGLFALYQLGAVVVAPPTDLTIDRMSIASSIGVLLAVLATIAATRPGERAKTLQTGAATAGLALSLICLHGYVFDAPALYEFFVLSATSLPTAICLLLLFLALLFARPEGTWVGVLCADNAGSRRALRFLPLVVLGPIALCYGALLTTKAGMISPNLRLGIIAVALAGFAVYITVHLAQQELEEDVRNEADHLRAILDGLETAIFVFDAAGVLRLTNRHADALSVESNTPERWLRETQFHSLADRRRLEQDAHPVRRLLDLMQPHAVYAGWLDRQGHEHALKFAIAQAHMNAPESTLKILTVVDETEGWRLRENLARSERLEVVDQLAGGMAHEMSNILGIIQLTVDAALLRPMNDADRTTFEALATACGRGSDLTARMLDLTRDKAVDDSPVDATQLAERVALLARSTLPPSVQLVLDLPPRSTVVLCDETELERAILNLVLNARNAIVEAGRDSGTITLRIHPSGETVTLTVLDDGPGMAPDVLRRACEPFFTTRNERGGSGLGLAMVDSFARRSGGALNFMASGQGGLAAVITLPITDRAATDQAVEDAVADLSGVSILVVEDDPQFLEVLPETLSMLGASVQRAAEAEGALALIDADPAIALMLTDIRLAGAMDGYALARRARVRNPALRVIFLSGYTDPTSHLEKETAGFFLRKPVRLGTLCNAIDLVMSQRTA